LSKKINLFGGWEVIKECLEAVADIEFANKNKSLLKSAYQDSPLEEGSRNFRIALKKP
jgi:hypothetical protein